MIFPSYYSGFFFKYVFLKIMKVAVRQIKTSQKFLAVKMKQKKFCFIFAKDEVNIINDGSFILVLLFSFSVKRDFEVIGWGNICSNNLNLRPLIYLSFSLFWVDKKKGEPITFNCPLICTIIIMWTRISWRLLRNVNKIFR